MQDYNEIIPVIESVEKILNAIETKYPGQAVLEDIHQAVYEINMCLYYVPVIKMQKKYNFEIEHQYGAFVREAKELCQIWRQSVIWRCKGKIEREFWEWYEYFKYADPETIYQRTVQQFMELPESLRIDFLALPHRYTFLKDKIDYTKEDFSLIKHYVVMMSQKVEKYRWLYEHLDDFRSKNVLNQIIRFWFGFNLTNLRELEEKVFPAYFDLDVLGCEEMEVIADLGTWEGKSIQDFLEMCGSYNKIYAYEADQSVYQLLLQNIENYDNIIPVNKKVGQSLNDIEQGVKLDDDINEPLTLIKMNIGGTERDALLGAQNHILAEKPKLAVAVYHLPEDIFEIPYLIDSIRSDYKFYLRFYGHNVIWPASVVLYAV